jgi:zinc transport system substrate-binding protein
MRNFAVILSLLATPVLAEAPRVVTDIAPVHSLVSQVMAGVGEPVLLVDGASDPHAFQLKPSQAQALADADAIFWIGPDMTPWLDRIVDGMTDASVSTILMESQGIVERKPMFEEQEHEDEAAVESEEEHHHHGEHDPHIWLDTQNAIAIVDAVALRLSDIDPKNAGQYASNAAVSKAGLMALETELQASLAAAYAHFSARFGVTIAAALAEGDAAEPGAAQVAKLREMVKDHKADCVFTEALHSDKLIVTLTESLDVPVGSLDPEGTDLIAGPEVYANMMRGLASSISECLGKT